MKSEFDNDSRCEREFNKFSVRYLWNRLDYSNLINSYRNIENKELQKMGVDVELKTNNGEYVIDEKIAAHYINRDLPTFAFELCSNSNGNKIGWLLNDNLKTTHYMVYWTFATNDDYTTVVSDEFTRADAFLLNKARLLKYLEFMGFTKERLMKSCQAIIAHNKFGKVNLKSTDDFSFNRTKQLKEQPINVVIKKSILMKLAEACFKLERSGTSMTKNRREILN